MPFALKSDGKAVRAKELRRQFFPVLYVRPRLFPRVVGLSISRGKTVPTPFEHVKLHSRSERLQSAIKFDGVLYGDAAILRR